MRFKLIEQKDKYRISYRHTQKDTDVEKREKEKTFQYLQLVTLNVLSHFEKEEKTYTGPSLENPSHFQFASDIRFKLDNRYTSRFHYDITGHFMRNNIHVRLTTRSIEITGSSDDACKQFSAALNKQLKTLNTQRIESDLNACIHVDYFHSEFINLTSSSDSPRSSIDSERSSACSTPISEWETYINEESQIDFKLPEQPVTNTPLAKKVRTPVTMSTLLDSAVAGEPEHTTRIVCSNIIGNHGYQGNKAHHFYTFTSLSENQKQLIRSCVGRLSQKRTFDDIHGLISQRVGELTVGVNSLLAMMKININLYGLEKSGEFDIQKINKLATGPVAKYYVLPKLKRKINKIQHLVTLLEDIREQGNVKAFKKLANNKEATTTLLAGIYSKTRRVLWQASILSKNPAQVEQINKPLTNLRNRFTV